MLRVKSCCEFLPHNQAVTIVFVVVLLFYAIINLHTLRIGQLARPSLSSHSWVLNALNAGGLGAAPPHMS